jgi:transposase
MRETRITSPYAPDLKEVRAWLENMIAALRFVDLVAAIVAFIARVCAINTELTKQLASLRRKRPRSERLRWLERQLVLPFGEKPTQAKKRKTNATRRGRHPGRGELPARLERIEVPNPVPPAMRICPQCGAEMTTVGHSRRETLDVVPAKVVVMVRVDETVACPNDDMIVSAPPPPAIVERGKLGDTLIVEATCDKFLDHQPIERQCSRFETSGTPIAPQTLGRAVCAHIDLLMPVAKMIERQTRAPGLLGTDATGIPVLDPSAREGIRTGTCGAGRTRVGSASSTRRPATRTASSDSWVTISLARCSAMAPASPIASSAPAANALVAGPMVFPRQVADGVVRRLGDVHRGSSARALL